MTIKAGDLVMVVHTCCDAGVKSPVFTVHCIVSTHPLEICRFCKRDVPQERQALDGDPGFAYPLSWLKKIPPLSELEGEKEKKEITA